MKVLDLFSGIGGFSLGLERAGMQTIAFCEIEKFCQRVLKKHWPHVPIFDDIRELKANDLPEQPDVICGGFPCTQTSRAAAIHGKRAGLAGKDSGLWKEYLRVITEINPEWCLIENPDGVKRWESEIQGGVENLGYRLSRLEIKASDFGLPHRRLRYIFIANRDGKRLEIARPSRQPAPEYVKRLAIDGGSWLSGTPGACGVFNGLPNRMERVRALGNSIIPQIPEIIGRAIMQIESRKTA